MKKVIILIIVLVFISYYCYAKKNQYNYLLIKKYSPELPYMTLSIVSDSCAILLQRGNANDTLFFNFFRGKYRLVVTNVSDTSNIISLNKGDTLVYYKKNILLFNEKTHCFFQKTTSYSNKLSKKKFIYRSKRRKLKLKFVNDSICDLTNIFNCPDIAHEYKVIVQNCKYTQDGNEIYLSNIEAKFGNDLYIEIPPQNCSVCDFLSKNKRESRFYIGPYYATEYDKYGKIPNITNDTLIIINNKIFYYKENNRESIGFIFKRK